VSWRSPRLSVGLLGISTLFLVSVPVAGEATDDFVRVSEPAVIRANNLPPYPSNTDARFI
jgi:hypothetical protein